MIDTLRPLIALALLLCADGSLLAAAPPTAEATPEATAEASPAARAEAAPQNGDGSDFIRATRVYFPRSAGRLYFEQSAVPDKVAEGISLRYGYDGATFPIDVFVYPLGHMSEAQALEQSSQELLRSFEQAQQLGYYSDVRLSRPRELKIRLNPFVTLPARQFEYTAQRNGVPVVSHSLLLYRSYYGIKVRITAPKAEKRVAKTVVQQVAEELLPALRLSHVGSCANQNGITIATAESLPRSATRVSADGSEVVTTRGQEPGKLLLEAMMRKADSACAQNFDKEEVAAGEQFETLEFPAGVWHDSATKAPPAAD